MIHTDALSSDHLLADLAAASMLHAGRPAVVTVGAGAASLQAADQGRRRAMPVETSLAP